jgi:hypothetical protein
VRLGGSNVEVDPNFRLYMVTRLSNPTYLPEASSMVNLVNLTITQQVRGCTTRPSTHAIKHNTTASQTCCKCAFLCGSSSQLPGIAMSVMCARVCVCMYVCVCGGGVPDHRPCTWLLTEVGVCMC